MKTGKRAARSSTSSKKKTRSAPALTAAEIATLEERLRLADAKFAGIVGISADAIISMDGSQRIVLFNHGAEQIFGYRAEEIIGQPLGKLLPPDVRGLHPGHVADFARGGTSARLMGARRAIHGLRKSGERFPAEASISQVDLGGTKLFTAVLRDVSDRARLLAAEQTARAAAEAAERRATFLAEASELLDRSLDYATTLNTLAALVVPQLAECSVIDVLTEEGAVRRVGIAHADTEQSALVEALRHFPADRARPFLTRRTLATGEMDRVAVVTPELVRTLVQNEEHLGLVSQLDPASWLVVPLRTRGQVIGAMAFIRCGSPRPYSDHEVALAEELARRAAQVIENARLYGAAQFAIRARDDVLAVVSHDLRNPLSAIAMCTTTLLEQPPADAAMRREMLAMIRQSVDWMHRIIQDLLDIASIEAGKLSVHRSRTTVAEVLGLARPSFDAVTKEHVFEVAVAPNVPDVDADADRVAQVLTNLVGNAAKFTPARGLISVRVERDDDGAVRFTVRDAGGGIAEADLPHIFDRFWHTRNAAGKRGAGLGLAIAKGIVEAHGGRIWAESILDGGSTFAFTIPAAR